MSILFVGSAPADLGGATTENTTTTGRDPDYTPVGSKVTGSMSNSAINFSVTFANTLDMWMHFLVHTGDSYAPGNSNLDGKYCTFYGNGTEIASLDVTDGVLSILGADATSAVISNFAANTQYHMDFHLVDNGSTYTLEVFQNGISAGSHTWTQTETGVDHVAFDHDDIDVSGTETWYYSEFIVTDAENTIGWRLATLAPAADGFHTDWDGSYLGLSNSFDGVTISSDTATERQSWTLGAYGGPATTSGVRAVVNKIMASAGSTGPQNLAPFLRIGGTDYDESSYTPDGTPQLTVVDNDPSTAAAWDTATFATMEAGVKSET